MKRSKEKPKSASRKKSTVKRPLPSKQGRTTVTKKTNSPSPPAQISPPKSNALSNTSAVSPTIPPSETRPQQYTMQHTHHKMTAEERLVLSVLDDAPVEDFVHYIGRVVDISGERIRHAVETLKREGYVEILEDNDILHFFHTKKTTPDMIDQTLYDLTRFGKKELKYIPD